MAIFVLESSVQPQRAVDQPRADITEHARHASAVVPAAVEGVEVDNLALLSIEVFSVTEMGTSVIDVFRDSAIQGLKSEDDVREELQRSKMGLTELAAAYLAMRSVSPGSWLTIVHDRYEVETALERGPAKHGRPAVSALVRECDRLREHITVRFRHKYAHQKERVGRDDLAHWNNRADVLAAAPSQPEHEEADRWFKRAGLRRHEVGGPSRYRFDTS